MIIDNGSCSKLCSLSVCLPVCLNWYTSRHKALLAPQGSNVYCKPLFCFTSVVYILVCKKKACIRMFEVCFDTSPRASVFLWTCFVKTC